MTRETCGSCDYWVTNDSEKGHCTKNPPAIIEVLIGKFTHPTNKLAHSDIEYATRYPITDNNFPACGEFKMWEDE